MEHNTVEELLLKVAELEKENQELKEANLKMYNLDDVTVDCRDHKISFTYLLLKQGEPVHSIVFDKFSILLTEKQWERIVY